jgi:hypothetical protein
MDEGGAGRIRFRRAPAYWRYAADGVSVTIATKKKACPDWLQGVDGIRANRDRWQRACTLRQQVAHRAVLALKQELANVPMFISTRGLRPVIGATSVGAHANERHKVRRLFALALRRCPR